MPSCDSPAAPGAGAPGPAPRPPAVFRSAVSLAFLRGLNVILSLALGVVSAAYFGTGVEKDCYVVAQTVPGLLSMLLVGGLYASLMVRLTDEGTRRGPRAQLAVARASLRSIGIVLAGVSAALLLAPEPILGLTAPGFGPAQRDLAADLMRLAALTMAGGVLFSVVKALVNSRHDFTSPMIATLVIGGVSLVITVACTRTLGIFALALGPCVGTALAVLALGAWAWHGSGPAVDAPPVAATPAPTSFLWSSFLPLSIGANFGQINLLVDNAFASLLPPGNITILGFAFVIVTGAEALTTFALAEVALPHLVAAGTRGGAELAATLRAQIRAMLMLTAPLAAGTLVFAEPLCRLLFERGAFRPEATSSVARALACYSVELVAMGYLALFWRLLLVRGRTVVLAWTAIGAIAANAGLDFVLLRPFGIAGIALSTSAVVLLQAAALAYLARGEVGAPLGLLDGGFLARVGGAAAIMAAAVAAWTLLFERWVPTATLTARLAEVAGGLALGAAVYGGMLLGLRVQEARTIARKARHAALAWRGL